MSRSVVSQRPPSSVAFASTHALGWLVFGNAVGLYLSLLLLDPALQAGVLGYGRWVPVHLNVQLYGWTSLPLVAWLFAMYQVEEAGIATWAAWAVRLWSAALAVGVIHWLYGETSGKIFLDWKSGALAAWIAAQCFLLCVLAQAWRLRSASWPRLRRIAAGAVLACLLVVPAVLVFASSPAVYPPVDRTTGGPTGSSLLGSSLSVVCLLLLLPRMASLRCVNHAGRGVWWYLAVSFVVFLAAEAAGGTHFDVLQIGAMALLLPWIWWLPRDWRCFDWPACSHPWRAFTIGWWMLLVLTGVLMYLPGSLDHLKFTNGLVAHSHLAMAGFTTSFSALLIGVLTGRMPGRTPTIVAWHVATLIMIVALAAAGWMEGSHPSWMHSRPWWREAAFVVRTCCGAVMLAVSAVWLWERRTA